MSFETTELVIIADSSPLIGLARIGQLDLLRRSAERVLMPPAVWEEVAGQGCDAPGAKEVEAEKWLSIEKPPDPRVIVSLKLVVDRGEAEAIALALSIDSSLLLIDDSRARRVAQQLGVRLFGTIGLLRRAKKAGWITELRIELEALQGHGIYIRQQLIDAVLADVGE